MIVLRVSSRDGRLATPASPPFRRLRASALSEFVITCEHASMRLPFPVEGGREVRRILRSHWGWDIGAWSLTRELSRRLGAASIAGRWSRLLVDLNRRADDPTLVRRRVEGHDLPWNRRLTSARIESRLLRYHVPYHVEFDRIVLRHLVRGIRPILVAIHTFTPDLEGPRDFDAGILFRDHSRQARRVADGLRRGGLRVRFNEPYSGLAGMMYSVDRHGSHHGLVFLELELNQALFETPSETSRLATIVAGALGDLVGAG